MIGQSCVNKDGGCSTLSLSALAAPCLGLLHGEDEERRRKRNRKVYKRQWISRREERGVFHQLIRELEVGDVLAYKEFFRMTKEQFCFLLGKVSPLIQKKEQPTPINAVRATIQPDERVAVTLLFFFFFFYCTTYNTGTTISCNTTLFGNGRESTESLWSTASNSSSPAAASAMSFLICRVAALR